MLKLRLKQNFYFLSGSLNQSEATLFISAVTLLFFISDVHPHTVATAGLETLTLNTAAKNASLNSHNVIFKIVSL
jgi:hypothetical protein